MPYDAIIGMEVHVQLLTASKMFCCCSADYASAPPNSHACPVCLGMPGVLPVINQAAVEATILTGLALNCEIPEFSKFDRKNYPYPDLPKGYQISQYDLPLCVDGHLEIECEGVSKRVGIRRVHLEEDTAKLIHQKNGSLIDFNRAGVPLMEIVSDADLCAGEEAWDYLTRLRAVLRCLGVSTGNMEEGAMRCEANISVRPSGTEELGTKVEVKNLNSFRAVRQAISYEITRQSRLLDEGTRVRQVTMGWDENRRRTVFQRSKEYAADYRYFPEPDLPPLQPSEASVEAIRCRLPELPEAKRERFITEYDLKSGDAQLLSQDGPTADYFEAACISGEGGAEPQHIANWMLGELFRLLHENSIEITQSAVTPGHLVELLTLVSEGAISATSAKEVLELVFSSGESPGTIIEQSGLTQITDQESLGRVAREVMADNARAVREYLDGKDAALGFLIGQVMRATRGQANAQIARKLLLKEISEGAL